MVSVKLTVISTHPYKANFPHNPGDVVIVTLRCGGEVFLVLPKQRRLKRALDGISSASDEDVH
jgi:hypothetical protein